MTKSRKRTVVTAVERAIEDAARRPDVPIADGLAEVTAVKLADAVMATPEVNFAVNGEPWFQSYVTLGSLVALVGGCYGLGYDFLDGSIPTPSELTAHLPGVFGPLLALYGRWFALKPVGT
jgi:predicted cupin superfamily sugar epimerase